CRGGDGSAREGPFAPPALAGTSTRAGPGTRPPGRTAWRVAFCHVSPMEALASYEGLVKRYKHAVAVDGLTFEVSEGDVSGLLGPNGAGKTTAIRVLLGLARPTAGTTRLFGAEP